MNNAGWLLRVLVLWVFVSCSRGYNNEPAMPKFWDRTWNSGIEHKNGFKYGGPVITDLDGDGWDDLILNEHELSPLRVYTRNTNLSFNLKFQDSISPDWHGISAFDFEGNGRQDLVIARGGAFGVYPSALSVFRFTDGEPAFELLPHESYGLDQYKGRLRAIRFMDLDLDGDQDLLVTARTKSPPQAEVLGEMAFFENNGSNTWRAHTQGTGVFNAKCSSSVLVTDIDNDGILDLVCGEQNVLSVYKGTGSFPTPFVDVSSIWLAGLSRTSRNFYDYMKELDYDNDGHMDVYISCGLNYTMLACDDLLLRNTGAGFVDVSREAGIPFGGIHQEPAVGDFNLDGFVDLLVPAYRSLAYSPNLLLVNRGDGTFKAVYAHGANVISTSEFRAAGAGAILMSSEGLLDIVVGYEGSGAGGPWKLYKNETPKNENKFLGLRVEDLPGRRMSARGARVTIHAGGKTMTRRVGRDGGESQSFPSRVHFGLGTVGIIDSITIAYVGGEVRHQYNVSTGLQTSIPP